jgi:hypothetical protein
MVLRLARSGSWKGRSYRLVGEAVGATPVPRRRKKRVDRGVLSADEIATRIMTLIRQGGGRRSIRGITIQLDDFLHSSGEDVGERLIQQRGTSEATLQ